MAQIRVEFIQTGKNKKIGNRIYYEVKCALCGYLKFIRGYSLKNVKYCKMCSGMGSSLLDRIKFKGYELNDIGCFNWLGNKNKDGYAVLGFQGKKYRCAKYLLEDKLKRPLKNGFETCHTCNNRLCINPEHLYEGTHKDNGRDLSNSNNLKGSKNKSSKITEIQALEIKDKLKNGEKIRKISDNLSIPYSLIENIKYGNSWEWL